MIISLAGVTMDIRYKRSSLWRLGYAILFLHLCLRLPPLSVTTASAEEKAPFRIAAILPFSGDLANIGLAFRNGIEMALESLPPHVRSQYQVEYEDDGLQPSKSVSAFQKLIHSGKIDLLLNFSSNTSKALAPLAERNKVPFLAVASDSTISRGKKFTYNFFASSDEPHHHVSET